MVDILTVPTPIFITNPRPNFIIPPNSKLMILVDNQPQNRPKFSHAKTCDQRNEEYEKELNLKKEKQQKKDEFEKIIENMRKKFYEQIDKIDE